MEIRPPSGAQISPDLVTHHDQLSSASEAFKIARTNIEFSSINRKTRSLMVTSTNQSEGKSITAANLAIAYAQMGRRVLLVDADLRRPIVHRYFGYVNRRGLTNVLIGAGHYSEYVLPTPTENLSILPSGPIPPNPADLLMSQTMSDLIDLMVEEYELVLFDCPPVGVVTDAAIVATKVDATVFVVRAGATHRNQLKRAAGLLQQVNARVLGFIMNGVNEESDDYYYYYAYAEETTDNRRSGLFHKKKRAPKRSPHAARTMAAAPLVRQPSVPIHEIGVHPALSDRPNSPSGQPFKTRVVPPLVQTIQTAQTNPYTRPTEQVKEADRISPLKGLISDDD